MVYDLTPHFSRHHYACKGHLCCDHSAPMDMRVVDGTQEVRDILGHPTYINSAFRCLTYNCTPRSQGGIGSTPDSQHPLGFAVDLRADDITPEELRLAMLEVAVFRHGGIGIYDWGCHGDGRLDGPARWDKRT